MGAGKTYFLTNGGSNGNLVSYIALRTIGEQVLVQRSVHSSVIDGIALAGLDASFVIPVVAHAIPAGHESAGQDSVLARDPRPPSRCRYAHGRSDPRTIPWDNGFRIPALCSASAPTAAYAPTSTRLARIRSKLGRDKDAQSILTGRTRSATSAACDNQGPVMTRVLAPLAWACIVSSKASCLRNVKKEARVMRGGYRFELSYVT